MFAPKATAAAAAVALMAAMPAVAQTAVNKEYVVGEWAVGDATCSDPNAEVISFLDNGAFMSRNKGALDAVGFWGIDKDEVVYIDVFASPSFVGNAALDLDATVPVQFSHVTLSIKVVTIKPQPDSSDVVAVAGPQIWQGTLRRCK